MARPPYAMCEYHQQVDCVVDATTFWRSGVKYRMAGIDPPDPFSADCNHERDMSRTAMWSLVNALNERGPVRITVKGAALPGNLGRPVDVTLKDGTALADVLVAQKAARRGGAMRRTRGVMWSMIRRGMGAGGRCGVAQWLVRGDRVARSARAGETWGGAWPNDAAYFVDGAPSLAR
jgi:hypothetical protein